jgi:hypothetical protein
VTGETAHVGSQLSRIRRRASPGPSAPGENKQDGAD